VQSSHATYEQLQAESAESRRTYQKFYDNLALFSGGTIALSVTYVGYLRGLPHPVAHYAFLISSWISLLICLVSSLFYTYFNTHYLSYARFREYAEKRREQREVEAAELDDLNVVNIQSRAELEAFRKQLQDAASRSGKAEQHHQEREKLYESIFRWDGLVARLSFILGLVLLLAFAITNR
jgi:hypothetical protein